MALQKIQHLSKSFKVPHTGIKTKIENLSMTLLLAMIVIGVGLISECSSATLPQHSVSVKPSFQSPLILTAKAPAFKFEEKTYHNPEYALPLKELPENYRRDIVGKFGKNLSDEQKETLLKNGVLILPGKRYDHFENAFSNLRNKDIPIFVTSDSILHLFHIEFNEILKNLEIKELSPMLKEFFTSVIETSLKQYNGLNDKALKELVRRNIAYLSVAMKLLEPDYKVPSFVSKEVNKEIERIGKHKGFYKSEIFSEDCPQQCLKLAFDIEGKCRQDIKKGSIFYQGKHWDSVEFYKEVCTRKCYCEDYSQYIPRGHYTSSEGLKRYFKSMMWLGRMSFKASGENWTKQAALLTLAVENAKVNFNGKVISSKELWRKIYSITGFFAGASDDLTFYDYANALDKIIGKKVNPNDISKMNAKDFQKEIAKLKGPKILGGFEIDLAGNLKDLTQGLRLIGQRYALDSQILGDLVYKNVGPNPNSPYYQEVLDARCLSGLSKPKSFYLSCKNMDENRTLYWNEICSKALEMYLGRCDRKLDIEGLYSVCRFMPTGLDVANVLGSEKAENILNKYYQNGYCGYNEKQKELKKLVASYSEKDWTKNSYNTWLWMLGAVLKEKPEGYPIWMRSEVWKLKDLIAFLASWAELRHDTILYVKQSYTWAVAITKCMMHYSRPIAAKYYGYVEPNPELFARAKYAVDYLNKGLEEQGVITDEVKKSLEESSQMMERLTGISEKELRKERLTEEDYDYIKSIGARFNSILEKLASALKIESGSCPKGKYCSKKTSLEGKDKAFKTSMVADVHTDANTKRVLEVGTGKIDWLLVAHKSKEGRIGIAVGPIFSYYEFTWPMKDRLTDEKWRNEVLQEMERPVLYKEINLSPAKGYIVK